MLESSLAFLQCMVCKGRLELDVLVRDVEIDEGLLYCSHCSLKFPIIDRVPILYSDTAMYISQRKSLAGRLYRLAKSNVMKDHLKSMIANIQYDNDQNIIEDRWTRIYQNSTKSKFYSIIKSKLSHIPKTSVALEHGCSIGTITTHLAQKHNMVLGIDRSFSAIWQAKRYHRANLDYFVACSLSDIFSVQFGLVVALNVLEIIEPRILLEHIKNQISNGYLVISDPYDFERQHMVKELDAKSLRKTIQQLGFHITCGTSRVSYIPWNLNLYDRARLCYKVDLVMGRLQ